MKTRSSILIMLIVAALIPVRVSAQVDGLWEVTSVQVGEKTMTPVAKWTQLNQSRMYFSGNGWLQHTSGAWNYDHDTKELELIVTSGFEDEFGPFKVEMVSDDEMIWTRMENGQKVTVVNKKVIFKPRSLATNAVGLWRIHEVRKGGMEFTNEYSEETGVQGVFLRWDNLAQEITGEGRVSGIWRVDAHRPVLDILYYDDERDMQYWELEFNNKDTMIWKRDELTITYKRLTTFTD